MHDDESPACSAGARAPHCRGEVRPFTQSMTCRQHAEASGGSGRELGAALATAGGEDGTAGTRAHAQAEAVRLGAATVVRLEGALAHVDLRRLRRPHDVGDVGAAPGWGWRWPMRPQSASPWNRGPAGGRAAGAMGMRKRSQTRSVNDTGAPEGGSNRRGRRQRQRRNERSSEVARRLQGDTPMPRKICARLDCHCRGRHCRFSTLTILATFCTGCGQTCGQQGIVSRGAVPRDLGGALRCRHRASLDGWFGHARTGKPASAQT